jgi:hypothetical protein
MVNDRDVGRRNGLTEEPKYEYADLLGKTLSGVQGKTKTT